MEFVKKPCVCDKDIMQTDNIITCGFLVQEACQEYHNSVDSKKWEPTDNKKISKDETILLMDFTVAIEYPVKKTVEKVYCKIRHKGKYNKYGVGSSTESVVTCHKCGKMGHLKSNCTPNRNGADGGFSKRLTRKIPKWVTKKPMISDVEN